MRFWQAGLELFLALSFYNASPEAQKKERKELSKVSRWRDAALEEQTP